VITGCRANAGGAVADAVTLDNCILENNHATKGGAVASAYGISSVEGCIIRNNTADYGGGVYVLFPYRNVMIRNCVITGNVANVEGGGIAAMTGMSYDKLQVWNCTIMGNKALRGGGIVAGQLVFSIRNCIFRGNTSPDGTTLSHIWPATQGYGSPGVWPSVEYCDTVGTGWGGSNFNSDPQLLPNDHHLASASSPCVGRGLALNAPKRDIDGELRVGHVDVGADQYVDADTDGMPDWKEMQIVNADPNDLFQRIEHVLPGDDFDGDGISNGDEMGNGTDPWNPGSHWSFAGFGGAMVRNVNEGAGTITLDINLQPAAPSTVQVAVQLAGGTASQGTGNNADYTFTDEVLTFTPGQTTRQKTIVIRADDTPNREPVETVMLKLTVSSGPATVQNSRPLVIYISDPTTDSDGDGLPDWWETMHGLNPNDSTGQNGAAGNPDGDGLDNATEFKFGTNPKAASIPDASIPLNVLTPLR
jgi:hypothetical protein